MYPRNELSYGANLMRMMFSNPCEEYRFNDVLVRALDRIQIPHAEYEQNASNSTMRLTCRSGADPLALFAANMCLCGFARCDANEAALNVATP